MASGILFPEHPGNATFSQIQGLTALAPWIAPFLKSAPSWNGPRFVAMNGMPTRFPFRLHKMLEEAEQTGREHLICWLPCGTKIRIQDQDEFANTIMAKYCRHSKYKSFLRQLSMYKFQRISSGPSKGCYFHPHFLRNRLDLAEYINRESIQEIPSSELSPAPDPPERNTRQLSGQPAHFQTQQQPQLQQAKPGHQGSSRFFDYLSNMSIEEELAKSRALCNNAVATKNEEETVRKPSLDACKSSQLVLAPAMSSSTTPDDIVDEIISTFRPEGKGVK